MLRSIIVTMLSLLLLFAAIVFTVLTQPVEAAMGF